MLGMRLLKGSHFKDQAIDPVYLGLQASPFDRRPGRRRFGADELPLSGRGSYVGEGKKIIRTAPRRQINEEKPLPDASLAATM
jgi:hypothetical protein